MRALVVILAIGVSTPALAQHQGHDMAKPKTGPEMDSPAPQTESSKMPANPMQNGSTPMDHDGMDHDQMDEETMTTVDSTESGQKPKLVSQQKTMPEVDHSTMDHSGMDHSAMDMAGDDMDGMTAPMADETPPPGAGSGPARAADAIWGADAMRGSRKQLAAENGGMTTLWVMADRAEYRVRDGKNGYLWDGQGYYGGDIDKFWFKTEGEGNFGEKIESAEVQALWSHAIAPFFDLQAGVRQDFAPRDRTYAVVGIQGLAPYLFEIDAAAFLSDRGDVTARIEAEYDQRINQRLIFQPRAELNLAAQDVPELGIGAGIDTAELGIRLRYEFVREFAPYVGVEQEWKIGQSARYARVAGEDSSVTNYVIGIRFWF